MNSNIFSHIDKNGKEFLLEREEVPKEVGPGTFHPANTKEKTETYIRK
jgi:hypothetical protein